MLSCRVVESIDSSIGVCGGVGGMVILTNRLTLRSGGFGFVPTCPNIAFPTCPNIICPNITSC